MYFVEVDSLPENLTGIGPRVEYHKYERDLAIFMDMNIEMARVEFGDGEFGNAVSAYKCIAAASKRLTLPIHVYFRSGEVYVIRTDI